MKQDTQSVSIIEVYTSYTSFNDESYIKESLERYSKDYAEDCREPTQYSVYCRDGIELLVNSNVSYLNTIDILVKSIPGDFRVDDERGSHYYVEGKLIESRLYEEYLETCSVQILDWNLSEPSTVTPEGGTYTYAYALLQIGYDKYIVSAVNDYVTARCIDGIPFLKYYTAADMLADMWLKEVGTAKGYTAVSAYFHEVEKADGTTDMFLYRTGASVYKEDGTLANPSTWFKVLVEG